MLQAAGKTVGEGKTPTGKGEEERAEDEDEDPILAASKVICPGGDEFEAMPLKRRKLGGSEESLADTPKSVAAA